MDKKVYALALVIMVGIALGNTAWGRDNSSISQLDEKIKTLEHLNNKNHVTIKGSREYYRQIDDLIDSVKTLTEVTKNPPNKPSLWQLDLSLGYNSYRDSIISDGANTPAGRFSIGFIPFQLQYVNLGIEAGIQNGNQMQFTISRASPSFLSSADVIVKPIVDLLGTMQLFINSSKTVSILLKGGVAYRHLVSNNVDSKTQYNGELQAGVGVKLSSHAKLMAYYQGIYSGPVQYTADGSNSAGGTIQNIPTQHGVFLGIEIGI